MNEAFLADGEVRLPDPGSLPLAERLKYANVRDVEGIVDGCAAELGVGPQSPVLLDYFYINAMLLARRIVWESGGGSIPETLRVPKDREEMLPLCREALRQAVAYRNAHSLTRTSAVRKACDYIDDHFTDSKLSLGDVAAHVALSRNHLCTVFSQELGMTFIEYLTSVRIRRAGELLRGTNMRTSEVAYAVGYNDPHYFGHLFKKWVGVSPRDYRRGAAAPRMP